MQWRLPVQYLHNESWGAASRVLWPRRDGALYHVLMDLQFFPMEASRYQRLSHPRHDGERASAYKWRASRSGCPAAAPPQKWQFRHDTCVSQHQNNSGFHGQREGEYAAGNTRWDLSARSCKLWTFPSVVQCICSCCGRPARTPDAGGLLPLSAAAVNRKCAWNWWCSCSLPGGGRSRPPAWPRCPLRSPRTAHR